MCFLVLLSNVCSMRRVPVVSHCSPLKRLAQSTLTQFMRSHPVHSEPHQHFSPNTITIVVCGKKQTQSLRSSTQVCWCPSKMRSHLDVPKDTPLHSADGLRAGLAFVNVKTWTGFIPSFQHLPSASYKAKRKLYPLIVSDCYKLFPWNLLPDSWGLGTFFWLLFALGFLRLSVKMCFMWMDEALIHWRYLLNFIGQWDAEQIQLSAHHLNFILEALV